MPFLLIMSYLTAVSQSVTARLNLRMISSGRSIRKTQPSGSDFDILFSGVPRLMMRAPILGMNGSGSVNVSGEGVIEARRDVAAELDMLLLILADRDKIGLIDQNVRRHQHRIGEEARGDVVGVLLRFHLELRHAAQLAELRVAAEHPGKLCVRGHVRLDEHDVLLRIESAGNILRQLLEAAAAKVGRNLPDRDCVHIDDAVDAVIVRPEGRPSF